jgi:hypothetical protein
VLDDRWLPLAELHRHKHLWPAVSRD